MKFYKKFKSSGNWCIGGERYIGLPPLLGFLDKLLNAGSTKILDVAFNNFA